MTGDGTKNNPYKISSARELKKIGENLSAHYALCGDIELNGEFTPIGSQFEPFEGVLDGQGYTVKNLKITETAQYAVFLHETPELSKTSKSRQTLRRRRMPEG